MLNPYPAAILIIDPDPLMLTGIAAVLNMSGYECHCARDAEAAVKAARGVAFDLIICDMQADGNKGLELCQEIQQEHGQADAPLMFISSAQSPDIIRRAHDAGGVYHLRKPFDPEVLTELVDKALWMPHLVNARLEQAVDPLSKEVYQSHLFESHPKSASEMH